jgi:hypothetical protein
MIENIGAIPDDVITELITAVIAARADGDGVLTIAAVRARLEAAKLHVEWAKYVEAQQREHQSNG